MSTLNYATLCSAIEASEKICAKATAPPWYEDGLLFIGQDVDGNGRGAFTLHSEVLGQSEYSDTEEAANISFIAHARTALVERNHQCRKLYQHNLAMRAELERLLSVLGDVDYDLVEKLLASLDQEPS